MPSREGRLNLKATGLTDVEVCLNFIDMFRIFFFLIIHALFSLILRLMLLKI